MQLVLGPSKLDEGETYVECKLNLGKLYESEHLINGSLFCNLLRRMVLFGFNQQSGSYDFDSGLHRPKVVTVLSDLIVTRSKVLLR